MLVSDENNHNLSSILYREGRQMLAAPRGDPMEVSEKHLEFMMTKVFTFPRNTQFDKVRVEEKLKSISIMSVSPRQ